MESILNTIEFLDKLYILYSFVSFTLHILYQVLILHSLPTLVYTLVLDGVLLFVQCLLCVNHVSKVHCRSMLYGTLLLLCHDIKTHLIND